MSGSQTGSGRSVPVGKTPREIELQRIKVQAEAKAAQYHAMAVQLEAKLHRANRSPPSRPVRAGGLPLVRATFPSLDAEQDEEHRDGPVGLLQNASSWLISAVLHLMLILVLGALTLTLSEQSAGPVLTASIDADETLELEVVQLEDFRDESKLDESRSLPVQLEDPGMAPLGELTGMFTAADVSELDTLDLSDAMGQIGALFGRDGQGYASAGEGAGGATFFGVKAGGNRFAFVVDASSSMKRNGWPVCRQELIYAVSRLKPHQRFYVILFNYRPHPMFSDEGPEPQPLPATPENLARLRKWLSGIQLQPGTRPMESMIMALQMKPDAVYFLTDGRLHDDTEGYLKRNNKRKDAYDETIRATAVQTIGFYTQDGQDVLRRIAKDNGGTFRFVPRGQAAGPPKGRNPIPSQGRNPMPNKKRRRGNTKRGHH